MANDDFAQGLRPINWPQPSGHYYRVQTGADLFLGMPCALDSTGYVGPIGVTSAGYFSFLGSVCWFAGTLKRGLATNDPFLDVSDLTPPDPSSDTGDRYVFVADDPNQEFVIQGDSGGTMAGVANAGEAAVMLYRATSGNTNTGWANLELDASTNVATTAGLVHLIRLHDVVNQDGTENTGAVAYTKWVVKVLSHQRGGIQAPNLNIVV